jgi:flagellar hook-basal body complex protein FliE
MSAINPIQGSGLPIQLPRQAEGDRNSSASRPGFGEMLKDCLDQVDGQQQVSASTIQDLLTGKTQDVIPVVAAVAKADLSFQLLIGVRNKVIEAYKQTINMPL